MDVQIETFLERYPQAGDKVGDILTLRPGAFGEAGHLVRVAATDRGLVWEQGGKTQFFSGLQLMGG